MLDEQDGETGGRQSAEQPGHEIRLGRREAGGRFVEQQQARRRRERAPELDQARKTRRHRVDSLIRLAFESDRIEDLVRHRARVDLLFRPPGSDLGGDHDVLARRQRAEHLEPLERARDAAARALVRLLLLKLGGVERDVPAGRLLQTGDHVEQRRLAGAVRTDQPGDLSFVRAEVDVL